MVVGVRRVLEQVFDGATADSVGLDRPGTNAVVGAVEVAAFVGGVETGEECVKRIREGDVDRLEDEFECEGNGCCCCVCLLGVGDLLGILSID